MMAGLTPNTSRRTILICSNGFYLRVTDDKIDGVTDLADKNSAYAVVVYVLFVYMAIK
jgi:hypothetical protein